ncbi:MAG: TIGR00266 family protein [Phycisphaerales bacterium]|nr:TIGR00266 family protein [Phycisphaerales bacterium]
MSETGWHYAENGKSVGPMTRDQLAALLPKLQGGATLVFGPTMTQWTEARHVSGLWSDRADFFQNQPSPPPSPAAGRRAHEIDYKVYGDDMQFVEVELDPSETVVAEAGAMMYMTSGIHMDTHLGDPSEQNQGFLGKVFSAGKRMLTGESLFMTTFSNNGQGKQRVAFAAPYPGKIIPVDLAQHHGEILCEKNSFLCAARGVTVGIAFTKRLGAGLFGGEGFILQRLKGDGMAFVHAGGTICHRTLQTGEQLRVDTGCIVALEASIDYDIQWVGGFKNTLFGGEGLFFATLTGPGNIWIQSLPFVRLADRIHATGQLGGKRTGEGSILGSLGSVLDGDNR